jgi:hypothetical protein
MRVFMKLMIRLRGLPERRARWLWSKFLDSIRTGAIPVGRISGTDRKKNGRNSETDGPNLTRTSTCNGQRNYHPILLHVPPCVRWKRVRGLLNNLRDQLYAPQSHIVNSIRLCDKPALPIGVMLFRH